MDYIHIAASGIVVIFALGYLGVIAGLWCTLALNWISEKTGL